MSELRAISVVPGGALGDDFIALPYDGRLLRRKRLTSENGRSFVVDLAEVTSLNDGDALSLEDGSAVDVRAAPEELLDVSGDHLHRLAWHIGNRHTPCQIEDTRLLIQRDHVLRDMLKHLGATVREVVEPFTPEGGAYGHGRTFSHSHGHAGHHSHDHDHSHE